MLRLVLLLVYLMASSSTVPHTKQGGGIDPLGLNVPPPQTQTEGGSGADPLG
jgi:hypothetical protein